MAKFRDEAMKKLVAMYIPNFDFEKERGLKEILQITQIVKQKKYQEEVKSGIETRKELIKKRGLIPGTSVRVCGEDRIFSIQSISSRGHIRLLGRKGSFNPMILERED